MASVFPIKLHLNKASAETASAYVPAKRSNIVKNKLIILCALLFIVLCSRLSVRFSGSFASYYNSILNLNTFRSTVLYHIFTFSGSRVHIAENIYFNGILFQSGNGEIKLKDESFLIRALVIRAEVCLAPCHHRLQDGDETLAKFGERIFYLRRDFSVNFPVEKPVAFQFPELLSERGLCNTVKAAQQFPEPLDFVKGYIP